MRGKSIRGNSAHFLALRKRLDLLGYVDLPLGLDTAPLAQQLLEDLVTTTEALRQNEDELNKTKEKLDISETQIEPLQSENTRLTRENVQLHQQLIMASEEAQRLENQHSAAAFELQNENRRLKLLNQKAAEHVKNLQKDRDQIKEKLQQSIAAPSMMKVPEVIESDPRIMKTRSRTASNSRGTSVVSSESSFSAPNISFDPNLFNTELDNLRKERDQARKDAEVAITKMNELENIVKIRDNEIHRLGSELQKETGRDGFLVSLRHKYDQQQEEIEKLRAQVRVVNPNQAGPRRQRALVLTPPRTMVSIEDSVFIETSKTPSIFSSAKEDTTDFDMDDTTDDEPPVPRAPIKPEKPPVVAQENQAANKKVEQKSDVSDENKNNDDNDGDKSDKSDDDNDDNHPHPPPRIRFETQEPIPMPSSPSRSRSSRSAAKAMKVQIQKQQQQQQIQLQQQQQKFQATIDDLNKQKSKLQEKIERIEKKHQKMAQAKEKEINNIRNQLDNLTKQLTEKDRTISSMAADFAFINDNVSQVLAEKDQIISDFKSKVSEPSEIIYDTEEIDKLQFQLDEMKVEYEKQIESKDKQIAQLQGLAQTLSGQPVSDHQCQECVRLRQLVEELQKEKESTENAAPEEVQKLKARINQLEILIRASQEESRESAALDEQLQITKNLLTERDAQMGQLHAAAAQQQNEIKDLQRKLEEADLKIKNLPDVEARYRTVIEQLKSEHVAINNEIKQKRSEAKSLTEKVIESQKVIRELNTALQSAREEASNAREEAAFHRAKSEEITKRAQEKSNTVVRDANAAVQHLQKQLQEKTKEAEVFQKLLSDARRQIAPLTETVIPRYKSQIMKMEQEKDELLKKVKRISQLAIYVDTNMPESPDSAAFTAAVHQLQDELRPFA